MYITGLNSAMLYASSIGQMLNSFRDSLGSWVKIAIVIIGGVMLFMGIVQLAKNLISHGKGQTNWIVTMALILIGGVLMLSSGWDFISSFTSSTNTTLEDIASGSADTTGNTDTDFGN